jgi:hypothetical protein
MCAWQLGKVDKVKIVKGQDATARVVSKRSEKEKHSTYSYLWTHLFVPNPDSWLRELGPNIPESIGGFAMEGMARQIDT